MTHDELAAYLYGLSWDQEADRLSAVYAEFFPQQGDWGAERYARAQAMVLEDMRLCGHPSRQESAGLNLQVSWWRNVASELQGRTLVALAQQGAGVSFTTTA